MSDFIEKEFKDHSIVLKKTIKSVIPSIEAAAGLIIDSMRSNGKLIIFGNGGSAADSQHMASEFTGRFLKKRDGLPALALTTDSSAITAIANDFGFDNIFSRQIEAIASPKDTVLGISTSGKSLNVLNAFKKSKEMGCNIISLTGNNGGKMRDTVDVNINVSSEDTPRIQEIHILIIHILCGLCEDNL